MGEKEALEREEKITGYMKWKCENGNGEVEERRRKLNTFEIDTGN